MRLSELTDNQKGVITKVKGQGSFRKRIAEMGFVRGKEVFVVKNAPLKDPVEYRLMGYDVSLRRSESELIEVVTPEEALALAEAPDNGTLDPEVLVETARRQQKHIHVALVGNPNCGKTTFFNLASGAREHVGNYSGVTVDAHVARLRHGEYTISLADLPGTYSLSAYSPEEIYVRDYLGRQMPDLVLNVLDSTNLERNLYLTTQLLDMNLRVVCALNLYDEFETKGHSFDHGTMGRMLGAPFMPLSAKKGTGVKALLDKIVEVFEGKAPHVRPVNVSFGPEIEQSLDRLMPLVQSNIHLTDRFPARFLALKMLERDEQVEAMMLKAQNAIELAQATREEAARLEEAFGEEVQNLVTDARYGFISGAMKRTFRASPRKRREQTEQVDKLLTHRFWGIPIFIAFMWVMFQTTFTVGAYPMDWIDAGVAGLGQWVAQTLPDGSFKDLLVDGIISGVGGVIVFLPNIVILFFFISLMEDTGYMARAAFITDKLLQKIGLHGKAFIPLVMGFGCNVPAVMATRTLEDRQQRLLTIMINPFMSCSARLPVYVLIIGAFFPDRPGLMLFAMYFLGIFLAVVLALIFKKTLFRTENANFVMELPQYRLPTLKATARHMWHKAAQYLQKMGGVILVASILIWALGYFPRENDQTLALDAQASQLELDYAQRLAQAGQAQAEALAQERDSLLRALRLNRQAHQQASSYIGLLGKAIEPAIAPLGFDWKMGISLLAGVAAKEVVVSTMGVVYQANSGDDEPSATLMQKLRDETYLSGPKQGQRVFTPLVALSFMVFILIYFPCVAVIAAVNKEAGSWKWALFMIVYTTALAWLMSFLTFQLGSLFL